MINAVFRFQDKRGIAFFNVLKTSLYAKIEVKNSIPKNIVVTYGMVSSEEAIRNGF
ncbi:hypothetical protein PDK44_26855 [Bacillus cereus]|nr:hypothetical protein [Bacillus cereus]